MVKTLHDNGVTTFAQGAMTNYSVWGYLGSLNRYGYAENIAAIADGSQSSAVFSKLFDKLAELGAAGAYPQNMATIDYFEAKNLFTTGQAAIFTSGQWDAVKSAKHSARTSASGGARPIRIPIIRRKPATSSQTARSL